MGGIIDKENVGDTHMQVLCFPFLLVLSGIPFSFYTLQLLVALAVCRLHGKLKCRLAVGMSKVGSKGFCKDKEKQG